MALAAVIEAIFGVLGEPDIKNRQCPLAMNKWAKLIVAEEQLGLGLIFNTRKMSVAITRKYLNGTLRMIQTVLFEGNATKDSIKMLPLFKLQEWLGSLAV